MTDITTDHIVKAANDTGEFPTLWEVKRVENGWVWVDVIPQGSIPVSACYTAAKWTIVPPEEQIIPCACEREGCEGVKRYVNDPYLAEIEEEYVWDFWCEVDLQERRDDI